MTIDTAGLVERLRYTADVNARKFDADHPLVGELRQAANLIEALTQAAAPDMQPVAWQSRFSPTGKWAYDPYGFDPEFRAKSEAAGAQWRALYTDSQLSALQERAEAAEARVAELEGRPDENGFVIGHPIEKFTGEARWEGTLVASYLTTAGKRRYVVEVHPQGFQMIAVPAQLRMIAALTDDDGAALAHKGEGR